MTSFEEWEGYDSEVGCISEFRGYLQNPDVSSKQNSCGWVFWYPKAAKDHDEELWDYFAHMIEWPTQTQEEVKIQSLVEAVTSNFAGLSREYMVQFWAYKSEEGCLTTVGQPFAVVVGRPYKGQCWYRNYCEAYQYSVREGAEVGSVGRVYLKGNPESTPDLKLYSLDEFPLRNEAARCGLRSYFAVPVFDLLNWECYGVLELVSPPQVGDAQTFSLVNQGLKKAGFRSTHMDFSSIIYLRKELTYEQPESEIEKMMKSAVELVPQLHLVQFWSRCKQCINHLSCCMQSIAFVTNKDVTLNSCTHDQKMFRYLEACQFHHLQRRKWIYIPVDGKSCFCRNICDFSISENPLAHYAKRARLSFCFVVHLQNSNDHHLVEFFFQSNGSGEASFLHLLLKIMETELKSFKLEKSIVELRKTSARSGYEYVEWEHQHSHSDTLMQVMDGHTEKYSLSDFKEYLQAPDLSCSTPCKRRWGSLLFWREGISDNQIKKLVTKIATEWVWGSYGLVQFWQVEMNEDMPFLQTSDQPFALGSLDKGLASYRKRCMEHRQYSFVDDPLHRVFRSGHPEISPDIGLYSSTEFPLRDHALHCHLRRYIAFPVLDQHKKCIGVLECVTYNGNVFNMINSIQRALKAARLHSTHINFLTAPTRQIDGGRGLAVNEIRSARKLFENIPQLFHAEVLVTYNKCSSLSCMQRLGSIDFYTLLRPRIFCPVQTRKGIVGMVLASGNKLCFCQNSCDFSIADESLAHYSQRDRLDICFAICLQSSHTGNLLYVLQFFLYQGPAKLEYISSFLHILFPILKQELTSFKVASGQQLGDDLVVDVIEFPQGNKFTSSDLNDSYSSPFKFKIVHYGQKEPQRSINELSHFVPHVLDPIPSVLQEKSSNAATSKSRDKEKLVRKRNGIPITLEDLEPHFGKKIKHAVDALRVARSTIKRACRFYGIDRWPNSEKYIKNHRLFEAERTSHDFQHSRSTNLPPSYVSQPEAEMVMVKAKYEDKIMKCKLCLSATMKKLQEEVAKRFPLEIGSFELTYLDEDNDKILLACDDDLQLCLKGLTAGDKTCVHVFVQLIRK